ncbi:TPA: hypothetical protein ACFASB_001461, partial [Neisseria gonorrhoeae]
MSFIFLLPVQAPLRWGFSRIGIRCADELNYKRGHVQSQPFPQQNQRKMPSEDGFRRHKEAAKFAAWRRSGYFKNSFRICSLTHWEKLILFAPYLHLICTFFY